MKKIVIASMKPGAGKTSIITGIARNAQLKFTYIKPFGDRMVYLKKRLWDQDAAMITQVFDIDRDPEDLSIGFEHTKLRYMHDETGIRDKLEEMVSSGEDGSEMVLVEGGKDLQYGSSVHLDPISVARHMDAELVVVLSGDDSSIMDCATHLKRNIDLHGVVLKGVILNKVQDVDDFRDSFLPDIESLGLTVLGIIPNRDTLSHLSVGSIAKNTMAKVIAGERGLDNAVRHVFVGAMSVNLAMRNPLFRKDNKLIITSGDRSDMILAAIESNSSGIILTNNIVPNSTLISKASEKGIPLMVVPQDTYAIAMLIDRMDPVISKKDGKKIDLIGELVKEHVDINRILNE